MACASSEREGRETADILAQTLLTGYTARRGRLSFFGRSFRSAVGIDGPCLHFGLLALPARPRPWIGSHIGCGLLETETLCHLPQALEQRRATGEGQTGDGESCVNQ